MKTDLNRPSGYFDILLNALSFTKVTPGGTKDFSVYFLLFPCRNNFWLFGYSLSNCTIAVGTIFFPWEQFFFQYGLLQFLLESFQVEVLRVLLSSTKIEVVKVERFPWPGIEPGSFRPDDGRSTNELMVLLLFGTKNLYFIHLHDFEFLYCYLLKHRTVGQISQKCKETSN